jgi:hypothetical protein
MISIPTPSQFNGSEIPEEPGVYIFTDSTGVVLYISHLPTTPTKRSILSLKSEASTGLWWTTRLKPSS